MGITANVSGASQITASVGETKVDVSVAGGVGPTGSSGVVTVTAPVTNAGTSTSANIGLSVGAGLEVSGGSLVLASHTHTAAQITDFTTAVIAAAPPTTDASLLTAGTLSASRLPASGVVAGSYSTVTVDATGRVTAGSTHAVAWNDVSGKPSTFTPSVHGHGGADITIGDGDDNTTTLSDGSAAAIFLYTINDADYIDGFQLLLSGNGGIIPGTFLPTATANAIGGVKIGSGVTITDGVISVSTNYAAASHAHGNITNTGAVGTTSGLVLKTGTSGAVEALAQGTAGQVLVVNSAATAPEWKTLTGADISFTAFDTTFTAPANGNIASFLWGLHVGDDGHIYSTFLKNVLDNNYAAASHAHSAADVSFAATDRLLGRSSSGAGAGEEITCTSAGRALLDDADAAAQRTTLGLVAIASSGSASDLTAGTVSTARLGSGTANSTTFLRGDGTWATAGSSSASDLTSGTLSNARMTTRARAAMNLYLWSSFR